METKLTKTYGLYCPHCEKRILINTDVIEDEKMQLQAEVINISQQLASLENAHSDDWRVAAIRARAIKEQRIIELKGKLKETRMFIDSSIDKEFRKVVKEQFGKDKYIELVALAESRCLASQSN